MNIIVISDIVLHIYRTTISNLMKPSESLYQTLELAYDYFNSALFEGTLPDVIFTLQRQRGMMGYFAPERWASIEEGQNCHEIAINPSHIGKSRLIDVLETLVHEMTHCWQHNFGSPSRTGYHNEEWALKMIDIGLQPSSTGKPGGKEVGQRMSDYPIPGGKFIQASTKFIIEYKFKFPWLDRVTEEPYREVESEVEQQIRESIDQFVQADEHNFSETTISVDGIFEEPLLNLVEHTTFEDRPLTSKKNKTKYSCRRCNINIWGRPELSIICGECNRKFKET